MIQLFLNEIREGNKRFVSDDQFLKDILEKRRLYYEWIIWQRRINKDFTY